MNLADGMPAADFLGRYWQRTPLMNVAALPAIEPYLPPEELAWLATQDDVESRLIFTQENGHATTYRLETGPFDDATLMSLPETNWTLLVQDVEKHLPDFRAWLTQIAFIPDWRVDDVMLSFAVPGGGTGPHVDQYDVFLCQLLGRREWRLAGKSAARQEVRHGDLSLLQPFHDPAPYRAEVGDVLYLPPGVPHWGVAADHCMTLSIGMRAPTRDELRRTFAREFAASANPFALAGEATFYTDPDLQAGEAAPGAITQAAITRCRDLCEPSVDVSDESLAITLGCTVTELKAWLEPQQVADEDIAADLRRAPEDAVWSVHGMSRIAWSTLPGRTIVFANGRWRHVDEQALPLMQGICRDRGLPIGELRMASDGSLLQWLLLTGVFASPHFE